MRQTLPGIFAILLMLSNCSPAVSTTGDNGDTGPGSDDASTAQGDADALDPFVGAPPAICRTGTAWSNQKAFADITPLAFSVDVTQVVGVSISSADINGDFLPDLSVRSSSATGRRENWAPGKRSIWLLKNVSGSKGMQFSDVTKSSGLTTTRDGKDGRESQIVVFGDVDNDGDVDMFCGDAIPYDAPNAPTPTDLFKQDASELMLNDGTGHFALPAAGSFATADLRRLLGAASFTDYDRDGKLDLWLGYQYKGAYPGTAIPDQLMQGDGAGNFLAVNVQEGTQPAAMTTKNQQDGSAPHVTWSTSACDIDGDGDPDLLTASYGRDFNTFWRGGFQDGGPRFVQQMEPSHWSRDDNDDWTTNWNAQCWCQDHPTDQDCDKCPPPEVECKYLNFAPAGQPAYYRWDHANDRKPNRLGGHTGLLQCIDIDNDGDLDVLAGTIVHPDVGPSSDPTRIMRNDGLVNGVPQFTTLHAEDNGLRPLDRQNDVGDMAGAAFDFDNDGRLDVLIASSDYPGTHAVLFHQLADGKFEEVPIEVGIDFKHAHGVTVADFDRDGDLDVVLGQSLMRCNLTPTECYKTEEVHVFRNDMPAGNYVEIALEGTGGSNRSAIGARVWVKAGGVTHMAEVGGGHSLFGAQDDLVLHFGLGAACAIEEVKVRWPDGALTTQSFTNVRANYLVKLVQGSDKPAYPLFTQP